MVLPNPFLTDIIVDQIKGHVPQYENQFMWHSIHLIYTELYPEKKKLWR